MISLLLGLLIMIQGISFINCEDQTHIQNEKFKTLEHLVFNGNVQDNTGKQDKSNIRMKRQLYYSPYGYYRRPLPIFVGGGFGIIGGFGGRGFGGRGFGGRGFGGRGFGGRGFGGIGGRGIGGFGGRGGRG